MEVISCHGASQDGPKKLSRFMREVTVARIMKNSCEVLIDRQFLHINTMMAKDRLQEKPSDVTSDQSLDIF